MNIELKCGNARITNDAYGFVIQERYLHTYTKPNEETGVIPPPEYKWRDKWYYGTIEGALKGVLDWRMHTSEARSLAELAADIREAKAEISELFKITEVVRDV